MIVTGGIPMNEKIIGESEGECPRCEGDLYIVHGLFTDDTEASCAKCGYYHYEDGTLNENN